MKKLVLCSAITAVMAAGSVNAATLYNKDGLIYKLKGDFQVQLRKDVGDDQELDVEFDDLELKNSVIYDIGNDMKAFGQLDFGFKDSAEDKQSGSNLEEAYVGLSFGSTSVSIGKQNYATDEFGIEKAYETATDEDRFDATATSGDDVIRIDFEGDNVYLAVSTEIEAEGENSENGTSTDLFASTKIEGVKLAAAFQTYDADPTTDGDVESFGISASYGFDFATLAVGYSTSDTNVSGDNDTDQLNLVAVFPVADSTRVAVGFNNIDEDSQDEVRETYANITYKYMKNVKVFAEYADTDEDDVDAGFLAGLNVKF